MSTTLFEAPKYDPGRERRRNLLIVVVISVAVLAAITAYLNRNWPEEHVVKQFFAAIQAQDYEKAYGIWMHDPAWKQHPDKYKNYLFREFYVDWGPGGQWGLVKSFHVDGSANPPHGGTGVVVVVTVNNRAERARLWVEKKDKTLTFSPY
ncbi:MAG: hypothetical protein JO187_00715 [Acidobacteria bacterium]|nr:hypothetical protein [Acidobacteriota bacterium]